jgi:uncharacterized protein (DUF1800 family)
MKAGMACLLCVLMVDQPLLAASSGPKHGPTAGGPQIKTENRTLHALNRLTFGPRPGDVAAVEAMGLSNWFEMQLNPQKIDDSALNARLAQFPAMQLPQDQLMARYPSQQIIRQMAQRNAPLPSDPVEHAIYADQIAFYRMQKARQEEAKPAAATDGSTMMSDGTQAAPIVRKSGKKAAAADQAGQNADAAASGDMAATGTTAQGASSPGGDMTQSGAAPDYAAMAAGGNAAGGQNAAMLPKEDVADPNQAPAEHVEKLFRDLEAVKIINLPPDERMKKLLSMSPQEVVSFRQSLSAGEIGQFAQGLNPQQKEILAAMQNSTRMVASEEMQTRLLRDLYSERQLEAVMTDFWLNHFNVYVRKNQNEPYLIPAYERDVIRPHALGKFEDLLVATAESPAMQMYLDNWQSIGPDSAAAKNGPRYAGRPGFVRGPFGGLRPPMPQNPQVQAAQKDRGLNENYGRELMELHTLGVNGGYSQKDVTEVAKVFTGWTIDQPFRGGAFQFDERRHEPGSKTVLGKTINENGMKEGLEVLHMLATSPATAHFVSNKLAVRFVSDDPPPALVDRMAQSFLKSDGDIKTVLRTMFESPEFWAPTAERAKVKTPEEFVISAVRASGAQVNNSTSLVAALDRLGMPLYGMQTPNGYSWMSEPWVSTGALVTRMNFALVLASDRLPGVRTDWSKLLGREALGKPVSAIADDGMNAQVDPEAGAKEKKLEQVLLGQALSEKTRMAVLEHSNDSSVAIQAMKEFQGGGKGGGGGQAARTADVYDPLGLAGQAHNANADDRQAAVMAGLMLGSPEFQRR